MHNSIGEAIDAEAGSRDTASGEKGALPGSTVRSTAKVTLSLAAVAAAGWGILHLLSRGAGKAADAVRPEPSANDIHVGPIAGS